MGLMLYISTFRNIKFDSYHDVKMAWSGGSSISFLMGAKLLRLLF